VRSAAPELERVDVEVTGAAAAEQPRALVQIQVSRPGKERPGRERKEQAAAEDRA
jgi:hypothetical protein